MALMANDGDISDWAIRIIEMGILGGSYWRYLAVEDGGGGGGER
jgi:hypothetical protein